MDGPLPIRMPHSWLVVVALGMATPALAADPTLYVYLPTAKKARALQTELTEALPGVGVTVFGRVSDLDRALDAGKPDALLAIRPVLETRGFPIGLQGVDPAGEDAELYVVLGPSEVTPAALTDKVVGSLDLLGRRHMKDFVAVMLGNAANPDVKRVRSTEDLLPLLQFQAADVVVLPEMAVADLTSATQLELTVTKVESARVGLAAVAFIDDADRPTLETAIQGLSSEKLLDLGVATWRTP